MRALAATWRSAWLDAWANRRSFWTQLVVMTINDTVWVLFWILFFHRIGEVRGWDTEKTLLLFAILTTAAGIALGVFANARKVGQFAGDGELDAALTLPVDPLAHLLARRIDTTLIGDLAFGPILFALAGGPTPERIALFIVGSLCGAIVLTGFLVAAGSLTLFVGGRGEQADLAFQAALILASYPIDFFGGVTKILLFTAVPAAFISSLPAELVDGFTFQTTATLLGSAAFFSLLGITLFRLGMRRYASGAVWTRA